MELWKNKIYQGDSLEILKGFPDESIDMIITDPPYMISKETVIVRSSEYKYKGKNISLDYGSWDKQWKDEEEYYDWCKVWLKECVRILKPYRHLIFFFDNKKITPVLKYLENLEMKVRPPLYWIKSNPVPKARKVGFMNAVEVAFWFTKKSVKQDYFNWQLGQAKDYVVDIIPKNPRYHPTQKSEKPLIQWINYLSKEGDIILDPFMGSGTTAVAARKMGRNYVGIEMNPDYIEIAKRRLDKIEASLFNCVA